jgi:hypothetical protein
MSTANIALTGTAVANTDGLGTAWTNSSGTTTYLYSYVDEIPYSDSDYIYSSSNFAYAGGWAYVSFTIQTSQVPTDAIVSKITYTARAKQTGTNVNLTYWYKISGHAGNLFSGGDALTTSAVTYTKDITVNPDTGVAWTAAEVNGTGGHFLENIGVYYTSMSGGDKYFYLYDLYIVVTYTQPVHATIAAPTASMTLTGTDPVVTGGTGVSIAVPTTSMTLAGIVPELNFGISFIIPVASMTMDATIPIITTTVVITVPTITLSMSATDPVGSGTALVTAPTALIDMTATNPIMDVLNTWINTTFAEMTMGATDPVVTASALIEVPVITLTLSAINPAWMESYNVTVVVPVATMTMGTTDPDWLVLLSISAGDMSFLPRSVDVIFSPKSLDTIHDRDIVIPFKNKGVSPVFYDKDISIGG